MKNMFSLFLNVSANTNAESRSPTRSQHRSRLRFCSLALIGALLAPVTQASSLAEGMAAFEADRYSEASRILRPLAEGGDVTAQFTMGYLYYMGVGVTQSKAQAVQWYTKAANQGDATAKYNLGYLYLYGDGVKEDRGRAIKLFREAAEKGQLLAMLGMGLVYETAKFSSPDYERALKWYRRADREGLRTASAEVRRLENWMRDRRRRVRGSKVNMRAEPNTRSSIVSKLNEPQNVFELSRSGDWVRIQLVDGQRQQGWLHKDFIRR